MIENKKRQVNIIGLMSSACAGMFVFGIVMALLGAILPSLFAKINFDKAEAGSLFFLMNMAMLVMSVIFGPICDRFGFKIFLVVCSLLVAASLFLFTTASTYAALLVAAVILGFGGGGLNGGTNALTSDIHPEKRSSALNLLGIFFGFGALTLPFLSGVLLERLGLERILFIAIVLSLVPLILFSIFVFPKPKHAQGFPLSQAAKVVRHPVLWLCGFLLFFQSGNEFTMGGWISTYLNEHFHLAQNVASFILAGYWAAIMAGRLASSQLAKILKNETLVFLSAILSLIAAALVALSGSKVLACFGAVLVGLGFAAIFPTTLATVGGIFPSFSGTAFSVIFVIALAGGMTSPWLAGKIAQAQSLRQGLLIPVINCSAILLLQAVIIQLLRRKKFSKI